MNKKRLWYILYNKNTAHNKVKFAELININILNGLIRLKIPINMSYLSYF